MRTSIFACIIALAVPCFVRADASSARVPDIEQRMQLIRGQIDDSLTFFQKERVEKPEEVETRNFTYCAYYSLTLGHPATEAEDLLRQIIGLQSMDPVAEDYGTVPWNPVHTKIRDPNSIEFAMNALGPILAKYHDKLSPQFLAELKPHLAAAIVAVHHHNVKVNYTNIFTMKFENLILLGEAVGDDAAVKEGLSLLDQWLDFTRANGITEFMSPVYTSVAIDNLLSLYRSTRTPAVKDRAKIACDYVWLDISASTFVNAGLLAGAHSRSYDFIAGSGPIDRWLYTSGLRNAPPAKGHFTSGLGAYMNAIEGGYQPDPALLNVALEHPARVVQIRCGDAEGRDRYTMFTPDFAIGSTSCAYNHEDLQMAFQFAADKDFPHVAVFCDPLDAPYGMAKNRDPSGHVKPHHLTTAISCVQDHGTMLAALNPARDLNNSPADSMSTAVVFPLAVDEIRIDDHMVTLPNHPTTQQSKDWSLPVNNDSVLGVRKGDAACVVRLAAVEGLDRFNPNHVLKIDGSEWGIGRLVAYQYQGTQQTFNTKHLGSAVLMVGSEVHSPGDFNALIERVRNAQIKSTSDNGVWQVSCADGPHTYNVSLDINTGLPKERLIDGKSFEPKIFDINGTNPATAIWAQLDDLRKQNG